MKSITGRTGTGLGALAAVACVACCALPALIGAGLLSGGVAAFFAARLPVVAIVLAALAAVVFAVAAHRRATKAGCGDSCDSSSGCGCSPART